MKDVHIALSGGCVRLAYPGEDVLDFTDNLSFGPLCALDDEQGLQARSRWFQDLHHSVNAPDWDTSAQRLTAMESLKKQLAAITGQVTLWIGDNADEQLMLRALLPLLREHPVFVVNVTALAGHETTGCCPIETLESLWVRRRELPPEDQVALITDWYRLLKENAPVRIFAQGEVQGKTLEFHDPLLLQYCPNDYTLGSRVVGNARVNSPYGVGDTFLNFRLYALIEQGILQAQTGGVNMNLLQVRQA